jgi:hypothetical protein
MNRRGFISLLGCAAAAWPVAGRAQQRAMPLVGYLNNGSPESDASRLTGLRRGLNENGYVEGRSLVIEYRWAENQADRLPELAADLVQLRVSAMVTAGLSSTLAAKAATASIPIVFSVAADPVQLGLVASLNRPGGNLTGFNGFVGEYRQVGIVRGSHSQGRKALRTAGPAGDQTRINVARVRPCRTGAASFTVARQAGFGRLRSQQIGACPIDEQPAQITVTSFRDPTLPDFSAG